jgi:hypothetical protein
MFYSENFCFGREKRLIFQNAASGSPSAVPDPKKQEVGSLIEKMERDGVSLEVVKSLHDLREHIDDDQKKKSMELIDSHRRRSAFNQDAFELRRIAQEIASFDPDAQNSKNTNQANKTPVAPQKNVPNKPPQNVVLPKESGEKYKKNPVVEFFNGLKNSTFAGLLSTYISLVKFFKPDNKKHIDDMEDKYERFFGVVELRDIADRFFEREGFSVYAMEDANDRTTRINIRSAYEADIKKRVQGGSPEAEDATREANTLEQFVIEEYLVDYMNHMPDKEGKDYVTTLTGIKEGHIPIAKAKGAVKKEKKPESKFDLFSWLK